jgi:hypothetical protein
MNTLAAIHSLPMLAVGGGFALMGLALFALTLRKPKTMGPNPTRSELREREALAEETNKMRIGAGLAVALGVVLMLIF